MGIKISPSLKLIEFDPLKSGWPERKDMIHINNIWVQGDQILFSCYNANHLYCSDGKKVRKLIKIPYNTHNLQSFRDGYLSSSTGDFEFSYFGEYGEKLASLPVVEYLENEIEFGNLHDDIAKQSFARGLCVWGESIVIGGSSPATVTAYNIDEQKIVSSINITMDVRHAIHGLEVYPYLPPIE